MNLRFRSLLALVLATLAVSACDQGRKAPEKTTVTAVNVAPGYSELVYRREQRDQPDTLLFLNPSVPHLYDADTYDFFVQAATATGFEVLDTFALTLRGDRVYTFVLGQTGGTVGTTVLEYAPPTAGSTTAQILGMHAADGLPSMDVYLTAPGAGVVGATPIASLAPGGQFEAQPLATGDYEVTLTAAGDPATLLLRSKTITLDAASSNILLIAPQADSSTADVGVLLMQPIGTQLLLDQNLGSELRVINAATDQQPRDVALNDQFTPPLFSSVPFATPTNYVAVSSATSQPLKVTPAGTTSVIELDTTLSPPQGARLTLLLTGEPGTLAQTVVAEDRRRLVDLAKLRFYNAASQFTGFTDLVLVKPDEDPTNVIAVTALTPANVAIQAPLLPGDYDLWLRQTATTTMLAGPIPITLAAGGIYGVLATNGADTATANVTLIDDFP